MREVPPGFTGFKSAVTEVLPAAVMDPFHVVRLAAEAIDHCKRRVHERVYGHRGRAGEPLYTARRTLTTGASYLTEKHNQELTELFRDDRFVEVEATWQVY